MACSKTMISSHMAFGKAQLQRVPRGNTVTKACYQYRQLTDVSRILGLTVKTDIDKDASTPLK